MEQAVGPLLGVGVHTVMGGDTAMAVRADIIVMTMTTSMIMHTATTTMAMSTERAAKPGPALASLVEGPFSTSV